MEGGGNMKREGEGHRETESERRAEQRRAEQRGWSWNLVLDGERAKKKREGESAALWVCLAFFRLVFLQFRGVRETNTEQKKRDGVIKENGGEGRMEMRSRGGEDEKKKEGAEGRLSGMRGKREKDKIAKAERDREEELREETVEAREEGDEGEWVSVRACVCACVCTCVCV